MLLLGPLENVDIIFDKHVYQNTDDVRQGSLGGASYFALLLILHLLIVRARNYLSDITVSGIGEWSRLASERSSGPCNPDSASSCQQHAGQRYQASAWRESPGAESTGNPSTRKSGGYGYKTYFGFYW